MKITDKNHKVYSSYPILLELLDDLSFKNNSYCTILNYISGIYRFLEFINADPNNLGALDEGDILCYFKHLKDDCHLSPSSVNNNNSYLRYFFQRILDKPINLYKIPMIKTTKKEIKFLYPKEVRNILTISAEDNWRDALIIRLGICTGLRIDEVAGLKGADIDIDNRVIHIRESKRLKDRLVPIDDTLYEALHEYSHCYHVKKSWYLIHFLADGSKKPACETIKRHFYKYRDALGLSDDLTFHSLRHTFAVLFLLNEPNLSKLMHLMGHSSLESTSRYMHPVDAFMRPNEKTITDKIMGGEFNG